MLEVVIENYPEGALQDEIPLDFALGFHLHLENTAALFIVMGHTIHQFRPKGPHDIFCFDFLVEFYFNGVFEGGEFIFESLAAFKNNPGEILMIIGTDTNGKGEDKH